VQETKDYQFVNILKREYGKNSDRKIISSDGREFYGKIIIYFSAGKFTHIEKAETIK
jgi:hypothetical protein